MFAGIKKKRTFASQMRNKASSRACGVIGSRARLRIWCRETCRFESYQAHEKEDINS